MPRTRLDDLNNLPRKIVTPKVAPKASPLALAVEDTPSPVINQIPKGLEPRIPYPGTPFEVCPETGQLFLQKNILKSLKST